jgi:hypothetical protein
MDTEQKQPTIELVERLYETLRQERLEHVTQTNLLRCAITDLESELMTAQSALTCSDQQLLARVAELELAVQTIYDVMTSGYSYQGRAAVVRKVASRALLRPGQRASDRSAELERRCGRRILPEGHPHRPL